MNLAHVLPEIIPFFFMLHSAYKFINSAEHHYSYPVSLVLTASNVSLIKAVTTQIERIRL